MLKDILNNLPDYDRKALMLAFEQETSHYIVLEDSKYIGVNITLKNLVPIETAGNWSYGNIT